MASYVTIYLSNLDTMPAKAAKKILDGIDDYVGSLNINAGHIVHVLDIPDDSPCFDKCVSCGETKQVYNSNGWREKVDLKIEFENDEPVCKECSLCGVS